VIAAAPTIDAARNHAVAFDSALARAFAQSMVLVRLNMVLRPKILKKIKILLECKTLISSFIGLIWVAPLAPDLWRE
jgi:hypothetical protein